MQTIPHVQFADLCCKFYGAAFLPFRNFLLMFQSCDVENVYIWWINLILTLVEVKSLSLRISMQCNWFCWRPESGSDKSMLLIDRCKCKILFQLIRYNDCQYDAASFYFILSWKSTDNNSQNIKRNAIMLMR